MIKNRVKILLAKKGITQIDLAAKLNIQPETLSRTINGNPTLKSITDIATALNVEVVELFDSDKPRGIVEYLGKIYTITSLQDLNKLVNKIERVNN
ncbi:MAG: helix-turn-helix transcriptional regulator [Maribacter litoralis]|uniref:helix-turn-helix transcriptional regulator n=1 Tax=Maribacter litoralis TaxID=2059726 RepID=UPI0032996B71